jgi:hypothetical protein
MTELIFKHILWWQSLKNLHIKTPVITNSVITNTCLRQIGHFSVQIDPVITNPGTLVITNNNAWSRAIRYN